MLQQLLYNIDPSVFGWALIAITPAVATYCIIVHHDTGDYPAFVRNSQMGRVAVTVIGGCIVGYLGIALTTKGIYGTASSWMFIITGAYALVSLILFIEAVRASAQWRYPAFGNPRDRHSMLFAKYLYALTTCLAFGSIASTGFMRAPTNQWALTIFVCVVLASLVIVSYIISLARSRLRKSRY